MVQQKRPAKKKPPAKQAGAKQPRAKQANDKQANDKQANDKQADDKGANDKDAKEAGGGKQQGGQLNLPPRGDDKFGDLAKKVAGASGMPATFMIAVSIIAVWAITGPIFEFNDTWQLVINTGTTIVTFLMVFLIQNTQNRDAAAVQLKLDEIIRAIDGADDDVMELEDKSQEELNAIKERYSAIAQAAHEASQERKAS